MQRSLKALVLSLIFAPVLAMAADYPDKAVRLIVPFPPGGGTDTLGRVLGAKLGIAVETGRHVKASLDQLRGAGALRGIPVVVAK